ncbi:hypothetical protein Fmac_011423 [Flemingia macrophylla]|uniref:DUF8039 domain-containing protein n=1 Tax=Flemingia macrophylla TaxID=520843 RepID=A0ABD1MN75_9FABA
MTRDGGKTSARVEQRVQSQMQAQLEERLQAQMEERMQTFMQSYSQQQPTPPSHVGIGGSIWAPHPSPPVTDTPPQKCQLLLDGYPDVVSIGSIQEGASTVHHQTLEDDWVRVSVDDVFHPEAQLPRCTRELITVGQALHSYVAWPRRLVAPLSSRAIIFYPLMSLVFYYYYTYNFIIMFSIFWFSGCSTGQEKAPQEGNKIRITEVDDTSGGLRRGLHTGLPLETRGFWI